jgi:hypothetical protein
MRFISTFQARSFLLPARLTRVVFALALAAAVLPAQPPVIPTWPVVSGSRVRVLSPVLGDEKRVGVVVSATHDTLSFRQDKQPSYTSIGTSDIQQLEIPQGTHTRKANGALYGFLIGAVSGAVLGAATHQSPPPCDPNVTLGCGFQNILETSRSEDAFIGGILLGGVGAIVGTLVGSRAVVTWVPVAVAAR